MTLTETKLKVEDNLKNIYSYKDKGSTLFFVNNKGETFNVVKMGNDNRWTCLVIEYNDTGEDGDLYYPNDYKDFDTMFNAMLEEIER